MSLPITDDADANANATCLFGLSTQRRLSVRYAMMCYAGYQNINKLFLVVLMSF